MQRFVRKLCGIGIAVLYDRLEQRLDIQPIHAFGGLLQFHGLAFIVGISAGHFHGKPLDFGRVPHDDALTGDAVEDREVQLRVACLQIHEQFIYLIDNFIDPGVLLIDLVDQQDRHDALLQGFLEHEPCLRHGSLTGIHEQNHRIHGAHDAFDLRAEIRVPRRVDDVDLRIPVHDGAVL